MKDIKRFTVVVVYAVGMAWVEAAVVFYLRTLINRVEPYQPKPLPFVGSFGQVELIREAATLLMLLTVGILAGRTWRGRLGYMAIAFGVWDILYYVFLKLICDWPRTLFDWDILFLLPLPWWGPVLAPMSISVLMIVWGTLASQHEVEMSPMSRKSWVLNGVGIVLALYVFMSDAMRVFNQGVDALRDLLPNQFNWPVFGVALVLMTVPIIELLFRRRPNPLASVAMPAAVRVCTEGSSNLEQLPE